jgi:hypothetical protein
MAALLFAGDAMMLWNFVAPTSQRLGREVSARGTVFNSDLTRAKTLDRERSDTRADTAARSACLSVCSRTLKT